MKNNRIATNYAVTRKQKRYIAKQNMEKAEKKQFCKHSYIGMKKGRFTVQTRVPSYFAEHWREYAEVAV